MAVNEENWKRTIDENEAEDETSPPKKLRQSFCVDSFIGKLRGAECNTALEEFLQLCRIIENEDNPALKFLREDGQMKDILNVIDKGHCQSPLEVSTVFATLHLLLLRVLAHVPEQKDNAEQVCCRLLSNYLHHIHNHLSVESSARLKKVVLKLLTAVVTLNVKLAKDVLSYVSFSPQVLDKLVETVKTKDRESVRICFIKFLMAFLVEGNVGVIRLLLDKELMLTSIIPGLVFDDSRLVIFVLTTLRTKLVEVMEITKTKKMNIFNTQIVCELFNLYNWKGPAGYFGKFHKKSQEMDLRIVVNKEQMSSVAFAVHSLLLDLCTSPRYGVIFRDDSLELSRKGKNSLVAKALKQLEQPWNHKLQSELVMKIVKICPEMARIFYMKVAPVLPPRESPTWMKAISFATEIISSLVLKDLNNLNSDSVLQAAKSLVCPSNLLRPIYCDGVIHTHPAVRLRTMEFFQVVVKTAEFVRSVLEGQTVAEFDRYIVKLLPHGVFLDHACSISLKQEVDIESLDESIFTPSLAEQMLALVDLMLMYQRVYPLLLDFEGNESLVSNLLETLNFDDSFGPSILNLKVKVLQILTLLDTSILNPGQSGFSKAISTLLYASSVDGIVALKAQSALGSMLDKLGVLDSASTDTANELGVWIHCYHSAEHTHRPKIVSFLQEVLSTLASNPTLYIDQVLDRQQEICLVTGVEKHAIHVSQVDRVFEELLSTAQNDKSSLNVHLHNETIMASGHKEKYNVVNANTNGVSSLLMCVLEVIVSMEKVEIPIQKYLSKVFVHLLHIQVDPTLFITIIKSWNSMPEAVAKYINSWLEAQPSPLMDPFEHYSSECSLSRFFLQPNQDPPVLDESNNPLAILSLARLVCFHIVQLAERQQLTESHAEGSSAVVLSLFEALHNVNQNQDKSLFKKYIIQFLNTFFNHPTLVSYFSPLHKKRNLNAKHITNFFLNVLKEMGKYEDMFEKQIITSLLRMQLLRNILHFLKISKAPSKSDTLLLALQCITLSEHEKCTLIFKLMNRMLMEPWTDLLVYLLSVVDMLPPPVLKDFGKVLNRHLRQEQDEVKSVWIVCDALSVYLEKFPFSASHLPKDLFQNIFCDEGMKLASSMLRHRASYMENFTKLIEQENSSVFLYSGVLLHLMSVYAQHGPFPLTTLKTVFSHFKPNILKAMRVPLSHPGVLADHPAIVQLLISKCMEPTLFEELCSSLVMNYRSLSLCLPFHLSVIRGLQNLGGWRKRPAALTKLLLHQLIQMLQQEVPEIKANDLCTTFVQHMADENNDWNEGLEPDESWTEIPALFLRIALKEADGEKERNLACNVLTVLTYTLQAAKAHKLAELVFEMTTSHSRFLDIILAQERTDIKLAVLQLVLVCYQLTPQVMKSVHIPVWLGAYGASLSFCDQVILKILHCIHGNKEINLGAYRPFLWGEAAINHYSVRSQAAMSLWQMPQAIVALELLNLEMIEATIANFPIDRKLFVEGNPEKQHWHSLETSQPEVYDPAFMLPFFNHLMAPESVIQDYKFTRLGGLALTLACLGSKCRCMRAAALSVISRFHQRLDTNSSFSRLYEHYLEVIRGGIRIIRNIKNKKEAKYSIKPPKANELDSSIDGTQDAKNISDEEIQWVPKLPNLSTTFLARTSLVLLNPSDPLYSALTKFILANSALKLYIIPEYLEFMRNSSAAYRIYQQWLLETVLMGMKTNEDVVMAKACRFFKIIFSLFSSSLSNSLIQTLILQVSEAAMKVKFGLIIVMKCGLIPWLYSSFEHISDDNNGRLIIALFRVLVLIKDNFPLPVSKILPLLSNLPRRVEHSDLSVVLEIVHFLIAHVSREHLIVVLRLCYMVLDEDVVTASAQQLQISSNDLVSNVNMKRIKESSMKDENVMNTMNKTVLIEGLRKIVHGWLSCNLILKKKKKRKYKTEHV